nr:Unknown Function [uncultured bacterium]
MARILFIAFDYYDYTNRIAAEMAAQGHVVRRFAIEPQGWLNKARRRFAKGGHRRTLDAHHRAILAAIRGETFDQVVFLQAHQFSPANMAALKAAQPTARFVLYNWDSLKTHDYSPNLAAFDKAATFDPVDAETLGVDYLSLFALPEFYRVAGERAPPAYDVYFVGSIHSLARFEAVERLHKYCRASGLRLKLYLHCSPPRMAQLLRKRKWLPGMTLRSVGTGGILDMMRASAAVFDFASQQQSGLTMRVFENLAAGVKIIATNPQITREPFYDPDRILLLDRLDFAPVAGFIARPEPAPGGFEEYSLGAWVRRLLD